METRARNLSLLLGPEDAQADPAPRLWSPAHNLGAQPRPSRLPGPAEGSRIQVVRLVITARNSKRADLVGVDRGSTEALEAVPSDAYHLTVVSDDADSC